MKHLYLFALVLLSASFAKAANDSITFRSIAYADAASTAKQEKKQVLLYFRYKGCESCAKMEATAFKDKAVADYYNTNFVMLKVDPKEGDGLELAKVYNIPWGPGFVYLDANGNMVHKIIDVLNAGQLIVAGQNVVNGGETLHTYEQRYKNGERSGDFLYKYCLMLKSAKQLDSLMINEYFNSQAYNDFGSEKNIRFVYEFSTYGFPALPLTYNTPAYKYMNEHRQEYARYFPMDQVRARLLWPVLNMLGTINDEAEFLQKLELLKEYDNGEFFKLKYMGTEGSMAWIVDASLMTSTKMYFYTRTGDRAKMLSALKEYTARLGNNDSILNTMAWQYYEYEKDEVKLAEALDWAKKSVQLKPAYANTDTYAALLFKTGKYKDAQKQAEKAISLAKKEKKTYKDTSALLEKIKDKQKKS